MKVIGTKDTVIEQDEVSIGGVVVTVRTFTEPNGEIQVYASVGHGWKRLTP